MGINMKDKVKNTIQIYAPLLLVVLFSLVLAVATFSLYSDDNEPEPDILPEIPDNPSDRIDVDDGSSKPANDIEPEEEDPLQQAVIYATQGSSGSSRSSGPQSSATVEDVEIDISSGDYELTQTRITGNLTITGTTAGIITLPSTLSIDGDLFVNAPAATVNNYANVGGTITIHSVYDKTWNQYGNARMIIMDSNWDTLNFMSGTVTDGIYITGRGVLLNMNGGSTPRITFLARGTLIINSTATSLPSVNVTEDAENTIIENFANDSLNLELYTNTSISGNILPSNETFAKWKTSPGIITVNPSTTTVYNSTNINVTYVVGQDLTNGTILIGLPSSLNSIDGTYALPNGSTGPIVADEYGGIEFNGLEILKNDEIHLYLDEQINTEGSYEFGAFSLNNSSETSNFACATLKVLSADAGICDVDADPWEAVYQGHGNYLIEVDHDTEFINLSVDLSQLAAMMTFNGVDVRSGIVKEIPLNASDSFTEIAVGILAEDRITSSTYHIAIYRPPAPAAAPIASLVNGTYVAPQNITLSTTTSEASIYYTTDGNTPTELSTLYTEPIPISSDTTIKAITIKEGMSDSTVSVFSYTIVTSATISPTTATFNKASPHGVVAEITWGSASDVTGVTNGNYSLILDIDYEVTSSIGVGSVSPLGFFSDAIFIKETYLSGLEEGNITLDIGFDVGNDATMVIEIVDIPL